MSLFCVLFIFLFVLCVLFVKNEWEKGLHTQKKNSPLRGNYDLSKMYQRSIVCEVFNLAQKKTDDQTKNEYAPF